MLCGSAAAGGSASRDRRQRQPMGMELSPRKSRKGRQISRGLPRGRPYFREDDHLPRRGGESGLARWCGDGDAPRSHELDRRVQRVSVKSYGPAVVRRKLDVPPSNDRKQKLRTDRKFGERCVCVHHDTTTVKRPVEVAGAVTWLRRSGQPDDALTVPEWPLAVLINLAVGGQNGRQTGIKILQLLASSRSSFHQTSRRISCDAVGGRRPGGHFGCGLQDRTDWQCCLDLLAFRRFCRRCGFQLGERPERRCSVRRIPPASPAVETR